HPGRDRVDPDAVQRMLDGHRPGHRDDGRLGGAVADVERCGVHPADRRDRHDRTRISLGANLVRDRLAHEEGGLEVGVEQLAPVLPPHPRGGHPRRRVGPAGDVDQPVEGALGPSRGGQHGGDAVIGRGVGSHRHHWQPPVHQGPDVLIDVVARPAHRQHRRTRPGGQGGHRGPDTATARAGDHHDAAVEAEEGLVEVLHDPLSSAVRAAALVDILSGQEVSLFWSKNTIPQRLWPSQGCSSGQRGLLSGLQRLDNVQPKPADGRTPHPMAAPMAGAHQQARYTPQNPPGAAPGWRLDRITGPSRLFGANGLRTGPDGRVYIAQVTGSQISALDIATGALETISPKGGDIISPDDVAFDPHGNLVATEVMEGRVSLRDTAGRARVLRDDIPSANGITFHRGRLFIGECREGGRLLEFSLNGDAPRVLLDNVPSPNAMEVGPDGLLYFPVMGANEIWRIDPDQPGAAPQTVATGLGVPDAVKFDPAGHIVSTQVATGQVLRIDPRTGEQTVLATLTPGLDNLTFVGDRLFVSNFTGEITEILGDGSTRATLPGGLNWPLDLAVGADGTLYVADGTYFYAVRPDGSLQTVGMLFSPGYPGFIRGVEPSGPGEFVVTTSGGQVTRYRPADSESEVLADGLDQLYGLALAGDGTVEIGRAH